MTKHLLARSPALTRQVAPGPGDEREALRAVALICGAAAARRMVETNRPKAPAGWPIDMAKVRELTVSQNRVSRPVSSPRSWS